MGDYTRPSQDYYYRGSPPVTQLEAKQAFTYSTFVVIIVVAVFVTTCVCMYGGVQTALPTRRFGDVKISKDLTVSGETNIKGDVLGVPSTGKIKVISETAAGHESHTLSVKDAGTVLVEAKLDVTSIIKLPEATDENVGLFYRIIFTGGVSGTGVGISKSQVALPNAGSANFIGILSVKTKALSFQSIRTSGTTPNASFMYDILPISSGKSIFLFENATTTGGDPGSIIEVFYKSKTQVIIDAKLITGSGAGITGISATSSTGYS